MVGLSICPPLAGRLPYLGLARRPTTPCRLVAGGETLVLIHHMAFLSRRFMGHRRISGPLERNWEQLVGKRDLAGRSR